MQWNRIILSIYLYQYHLVYKVCTDCRRDIFVQSNMLLLQTSRYLQALVFLRRIWTFKLDILNIICSIKPSSTTVKEKKIQFQWTLVYIYINRDFVHKRISIVILVYKYLYEYNAARLKVHQYFFLELRIDYICSNTCIYHIKFYLKHIYVQ